MKITIKEAFLNLHPEANFRWETENGEYLYKNLECDVNVSEKNLESKKTELQNAEPMRLLRLERNQKLAETDWWCASDKTSTQAQLDYRTALRDLPSTASPSLDENGNLTNVTWPTKPE